MTDETHAITAELTEPVHLCVHPTRAIYRRAADHIERHGLFQGGFKPWDHPSDDYDCPLCVLGALLVAAYGRIDSGDAWGIVQAPMDRMVGSGTVHFSERTTAVDAVARLRAVADTLPEV